MDIQETESLVKHTAAGEMPDASLASQTARRIKADIPAFIVELNSKRTVFLYGIAAITIGFSLYWIRERFLA